MQKNMKARTQHPIIGWFVVAALFAASILQPALAVTVDQSPLTVRQSLPPNIVLMLDDSGSMRFNVMPDYGYLSSTSDDALVSSAVNGVYYDPNTTYTPPLQVDGTEYPASTFTGAWLDGFNQSTGTTNITTYNGSSDSTRISGSSFVNEIDFTQDFDISTTDTATATINCNTGYTGVYSGANAGKCLKNGTTSTYQNATSTTCPSGYTRSGLVCTRTTVTNYDFFSYTVKSGSSYTRYYVGTSGSCAAVASVVSASVCTENAGVQQNVANWFSYYRNRMLMAKSGLMNAFSPLDPTIRFGFGSINGNFNSGLPTAKSTFNSKEIAHVVPFGTGGTGTQKAAFWSWLVGAYAEDGTPLRQSLDAVGQYYQSTQPWQTSASDTTELACRQSYTILTTDGFWNGDSFTSPAINGSSNSDGNPGSTTTTTTPASTETGTLVSCPSGYTVNGNRCRRSGTNYTNVGTYYCPTTDTSQIGQTCTIPATTTTTTAPSVTRTGPNGLSYTYTAIPPFSDSYSSTLADVAMYYWLSDLRTNTSNEVPTSTEDPAFWQHMTTFTLGLGFSPTGITPSGTTVSQIFNWANGGNPISGFSWPQPSNDSINNIADMAHAAVNGHGGFYQATSPEDFSNALKDALKRVSERIGSGASLTANSTKLETGTVTYQAVYYTGKWKGDLKAFTVNPSTGVINASPTWVASTVLPNAASRVIKTYNPSAASGSQFVDFTAGASAAATPPNLSAAQKTALGSTATAQNIVINYLRGDTSNEQKNNGTLRNRDTALGDIISSQPIFVGAPDANLFYGKTFTGASAYAGFAADKVTRSPRLWVAANDGMVHAFHSSTGVETFAYLPNAVILNNLKNLSDPNYGGNSVPHQYFNDGELTVADVYYGSAWHTVLVGTTGRGTAKAVYALDVTDPAAPSLLWERAAGDGLTNSNYIGQTIGKPVIAQTADGAWSVLLGNGYNSGSDTAALLQFAIQTGTMTVRTTNTTTGNGLASPAVWMDSATDGLSTKAFAGDLTGKVWSFLLSGSTGTLLYTAKDGTSAQNVQPITAGMLTGKDPKTGNLWLFFGTGRYLAQTELSDTSIQTWYGIIAEAGPAQAASLVTNLSNGRSALVQRTIVAEQASSSSTLAARAISSPADNDMSGKSGWYIDLKPPTGAAKGERMVTPNQFQGSLLLGTSRIPESSDPCNPSGSGWIMAINPFTGAPPSATFFDLNSDTEFTDSDKITVGGTTYVVAGVGFSSVPNNPIFVGNTMLISFDNASTGNVATAGTPGGLERQSWRELIRR